MDLAQCQLGVNLSLFQDLALTFKQCELNILFDRIWRGACRSMLYILALAYQAPCDRNDIG